MIVLDPTVLEQDMVDALVETDRRECARQAFFAWHRLWGFAELSSVLFGHDLRQTVRELGEFVASDPVRSRLTPDARRVIDTHGPVERCRHCSSVLELQRERERGFCTDCGLGFQVDVEGEVDEEDEPDVE